LAGATVVAVIALALLLMAALPEAGSTPTPNAASTAAASTATAGNLARSLSTSNVRAAPRPDAEVVAVLPQDREVALVARAGTGAWLLIAYPPGGPEGWLPAERLDVAPATVAGLPEVTPPAPEATPAGEGSGLPDLTIAEIYVVPGNRLAFRLQNAGDGSLVQVALGLALTVPGAAEPAALNVDVAALEPGGTAAVVTPVVLVEGGEVTIELDHDGAVEETNEDNNALTTEVTLEGSAP
jgi:hypothetical protein